MSNRAKASHYRTPTSRTRETSFLPRPGMRHPHTPLNVNIEKSSPLIINRAHANWQILILIYPVPYVGIYTLSLSHFGERNYTGLL